ncbi:hypothetical protein IQ241_19530 [Romeria aff. gracilis LEGE 07310]|uniref:Uncharacterized protein n=1 Tax=Vasconcelosia minhoensis LEGE 07310 TaxID=915328 RepID=A0A8J7DMW4_9CYAN|nr:hypothetical protein [Romeria gracilis]MBE9079461.1 hypothetical protein [Romeria aff. gracilis LEGE 07310]
MSDAEKKDKSFAENVEDTIQDKVDNIEEEAGKKAENSPKLTDQDKK